MYYKSILAYYHVHTYSNHYTRHVVHVGFAVEGLFLYSFIYSFLLKAAVPAEILYRLPICPVCVNGFGQNYRTVGGFQLYKIGGGQMVRRKRRPLCLLGRLLHYHVTLINIHFLMTRNRSSIYQAISERLFTERLFTVRDCYHSKNRSE